MWHETFFFFFYWELIYFCLYLILLIRWAVLLCGMLLQWNRLHSDCFLSSTFKSTVSSQAGQGCLFILKILCIQLLPCHNYINLKVYRSQVLEMLRYNAQVIVEQPQISLEFCFIDKMLGYPSVNGNKMLPWIIFCPFTIWYTVW